MNTIQQLRQLLDSYYAGTASQEDIDRIRHIFDESETLPDDLAADRMMFDALCDPTLDTTPVPSDLDTAINATIDEITGTTAVKPSRKARILHVIRHTAAAAAVIIAATVAFRYFQPADIRLVPEMTEMTEMTENATSSDVIISALDSKTSDRESKPDISESAPAEKQTVRNHAPRKTKPRPASGVKVVTDPKEAEAYTLLAFNTLNSNLRIARNAGERVGTELENINDKLNTILK